MLKTDKDCFNEERLSSQTTSTHDTGYQLINGVAITPEILKTIGYIQEDSNDALETWEARAMSLVRSFMTNTDGCYVDDKERLDHVWTICCLSEFLSSLKAPREFLLEQIKEERMGK